MRFYLGSNNPVNISIAETLADADKSTRFPVLNNGITIVSLNVTVQGNMLHIENYQIVNGCQTSNVLYENRDALGDNVVVNLKIVETSSEDVFSEIVRATNSQTKIDENQFFSLRPIMRQIEQYFNSFPDQDGRLYFERRDRQYMGRDIPAVRIFSIHNTAKCVTAMFLHRPDLAYRYQKQMYDQLGEKIFADANKEIVYYCSCLALYRLHLLVSNGAIPQNMRKFKWHILALVRVILAGNDMPQLDSRGIEKYCQGIVDSLIKHGEPALAPFRQAVSVIQAFGDLSGDQLKRSTMLDDMKKQLEL